MKTLVIGFGHRARQGKDASVNAIIERFVGEYDIRRYAFADELKMEVAPQDQFALCMKFGVPYDFHAPMNDPLCPPPHGKQGPLLQYYGTEYRRAQDPFYWVKRVDERIRRDNPQVALISDMRFLNERAYVQSMGGYTVHVSRAGFIDLSRDPNHRSEAELDGVEYDVRIHVLDGELEQLKKDAVTAFEDILKHYTTQISEEEIHVEEDPVIAGAA